MALRVGSVSCSTRIAVIDGSQRPVVGELHRIVQVVLDWDDDHLHAFTTDAGRYADPYYELDDCDDEEGIRLSRVLPRAGATIEYVYDFGASWYHTITLEKIDRPETPPAHPVCLTGRGDAPVEDWNPDGNQPDTTPFDRDRLNQRLAILADRSTGD
jgi:Plasmid pRiA4b ORF-3-like protein